MSEQQSAPTTEYVFRFPWGGGDPAWKEVLNKYNPGATRFLEIGSFEGKSATFFISEVFEEGRTYEFFCLDTWEGGEEHDTVDMVTTERLFDHNVNIALSRNPGKSVNVRKVKELSHLGLSRLMSLGLVGTFDFIYVDGSHQCADVMSDLIMSFHLLRVGGIVACDDYAWFPDRREGRLLHSPKMAIDTFGNIFWEKMAFVQMGTPHQPIFVKIGK